MAVETTALPPIKGVKDVPYDELFVSGHRTCQGCESALVMRHMVKASGPRTIVLGSTGCMYVANTTYYTTPWVVPWMHTQLGASGSAALGTAAGLKVLMRKGKLKNEKIRSEEHTSELQSLTNLVCRLLLEKKKKNKYRTQSQTD